MYAVTLWRDGNFLKLLGFVNNAKEYDALAMQYAEQNGGVDALTAQGYRCCMELAI